MRRRQGRGGLSGNVSEEAFCLKSVPGVNIDCRPRTECLNGGRSCIRLSIITGDPLACYDGRDDNPYSNQSINQIKFQSSLLLFQ